MTYNFEKHIELLQYSKLLQEEDKYLKNEDKSKYLELSRYSLYINDHWHWLKRSTYLELIKDFLSLRINAKEFEIKFCDLVKLNEKISTSISRNEEKLEQFMPNYKSYGFGAWISEIYLYCSDDFISNFNEQDSIDFPFAKNEKQLREAVAKFLPEIKKYF